MIIFDSSNPQFRPRAERDWIEVATFDYPLEYNNVLHNFDGFQDAKVVLPVIDVNSRLKELAPGKVDFDFAQDLSLQLPQIKVLDFVNDALNGNIGPLLSISNAIRGALNQTFDATGLNELSQTLREDAQTFFNPVLDSALDLSANPAMNTLYNSIAALPQTNQAAFLERGLPIGDRPGHRVATRHSVHQWRSRPRQQRGRQAGPDADRRSKHGGIVQPDTGER